MGDWATLLNDTAQGLFLNRVDQLTTPNKPVAIDPATGRAYVEGQPTGSRTGMPTNGKPVFQITSTMMLVGGGVALLALLLYVRK